MVTAENQFRLEQPPQRVLQPRIAECADRLEQLETEFAPDAGGCLRHLFHRLQAIEPRHQRIVQRSGNGELLERCHQLEARRGPREAPGLQHGLGQLLDEQRHSVGPDSDLLNDGFGQVLAARQPIDDRPDRVASQSIEGEPRDVWMPAEAVIEGRSGCGEES